MSVSEYGWRHRARCATEIAELFIVDQRETARQRAAREDRAKAVCRRCPVARECLRHALSMGEEQGIWGGKTDAERRVLAVGGDVVERSA